MIRVKESFARIWAIRCDQSAKAISSHLVFRERCEEEATYSRSTPTSKTLCCPLLTVAKLHKADVFTLSYRRVDHIGERNEIENWQIHCILYSSSIRSHICTFKNYSSHIGVL